MSEHVICPGCGASNPAHAEACTRCNFPLTGVVAVAAADAPPAPPGGPTTAAPRAAKSAVPVRSIEPGPRPMRPRAPRPAAMQPVQMQLWLAAGVAVVLGILYFAGQGFQKTNTPVVAGASPQLQQRADLARATLAKDSTNLMARVELANVLYDTANWSEAIIHYKSALRLDPMRSTTVVDLGVCYYNLGQFAASETLFTHALALDPKQVIALFNMGIVAESQEQYEKATTYFHRAMELNPPDDMRKMLVEHLQTVMGKTGKTAPPLTK